MSQEFEKYIGVRGNVTKLAKALKITKGAVAQWDNVPINRVLDVERITGIPRASLRPDFFTESNA